MDTAKAIGIIIANPEFEDVRSLEGTAPTKKPCVPIIAVPTTAGTYSKHNIEFVASVGNIKPKLLLSTVRLSCIHYNISKTKCQNYLHQF